MRLVLSKLLKWFIYEDRLYFREFDQTMPPLTRSVRLSTQPASGPTRNATTLAMIQSHNLIAADSDLAVRDWFALPLG
jgi:hypothetical protein